MLKKALQGMALAGLLTACSTQLLEWQPTSEGLPAGLEVDLVVTPGDVARGDPFTATLTIRNVSPDTVRMVTAHGCVALPHVYREGTRIPFRGTALGCTAALTTHGFGPGSVRTIQWPLEAELYAENAGDTDGAPAPAGGYTVVAEFDRYEEGSLSRPAVMRALRVR